jgi:hypothetical protein
VKTIGQRGFNNLNLMMYGNSSLQIGDEENYSELKFDGNVIGNSNPFKQNEK